MHEIEVAVQKLEADVTSALEKLKFDDLQKEESHLKAQSQLPDFWQDSSKAQRVMKRLGALDARLQPWTQLRTEVKDVLELTKTGDSSLEAELQKIGRAHV